MTNLEFYLIGVVFSFVATLLATYHAYGKVTVEDLLLCILSCPFSWATGLLFPAIIALDNAKFLDKILFKKKKR